MLHHGERIKAIQDIPVRSSARSSRTSIYRPSRRSHHLHNSSAFLREVGNEQHLTCVAMWRQQAPNCHLNRVHAQVPHCHLRMYPPRVLFSVNSIPGPRIPTTPDAVVSGGMYGLKVSKDGATNSRPISQPKGAEPSRCFPFRMTMQPARATRGGVQVRTRCPNWLRAKIEPLLKF